GSSSSPPVGAASPASTRSSVVFPEPFGPVTRRKSPATTETSTRSNTRFTPKRFDRLRALSIDENVTRPGLVRAAGRRPLQRVEEDEDEERDADHAVRREERGVQPREVARADQRVLVGEERGDDDQAEPVPDADGQPEAGDEEKGDGRHVERGRGSEHAALAEAHSPRMETLRPVDL